MSCSKIFFILYGGGICDILGGGQNKIGDLGLWLSSWNSMYSYVHIKAPPTSSKNIS